MLALDSPQVQMISNKRLYFVSLRDVNQLKEGTFYNINNCLLRKEEAQTLPSALQEQAQVAC